MPKAILLCLLTKNKGFFHLQKLANELIGNIIQVNTKYILVF